MCTDHSQSNTTIFRELGCALFIVSQILQSSGSWDVHCSQGSIEQKRSLMLQGSQHSPNTLPTIVHAKIFRIITRPTESETPGTYRQVCNRMGAPCGTETAHSPGALEFTPVFSGVGVAES